MKFLRRSHYCPYCKKNVFYFQFTTKWSVEEEKYCPLCGNKVISFWEKVSTRYITMIAIGTQFFVIATIYALWKIWQQQRTGFDIFITILDVFICGLILLFSSLTKDKTSPPLASDYSTVPELRQFRLQFLYILLLMFIGYILAISFDLAMWGLWILGS